MACGSLVMKSFEKRHCFFFLYMISRYNFYCCGWNEKDFWIHVTPETRKPRALIHSTSLVLFVVLR
jgi:hypothetical protein